MPAARNCRASPQIEFRGIDADEHVGLLTQELAPDARAQLEQARQIAQNLKQPHDRKRFGRLPDLAAGGLHFRTRDAEEPRAGCEPLECLDERRTERVARRLARHQTHPQRRRHARSLPPAYRTMLRELRLMKSTKGRISGCAAAALSSSSSAAFNLSPDRYRMR